jgi:hypothetical protein
VRDRKTGRSAARRAVKVPNRGVIPRGSLPHYGMVFRTRIRIIATIVGLYI